MAKRRRTGLGHTARKHNEYAHNLLDAFHASASRATKLAHEGKCEEAMKEAVHAAWLRGGADAHAGPGHARGEVAPGIPGRFSRGGSGIAYESLDYALSHCRRR